MQYLDKKEVGIRIKELRRRNQMTQHQLAEKLCYANERQLQRIENGEVVCSVDRLMEIAQILQTSTDYILFGEKKVNDGGFSYKSLLVEKEGICLSVKLVVDCI